MKLTAEQVKQIRFELEQGTSTQKQLAAAHNVSQATISLIKNNKTRKNK